MKLLALDTTAKLASLCLLDKRQVLFSCFLNTGKGHTGHLLGMIEGALSKTGLKLSDLDALVCSLGPGSFTALRIGISTVKGLALVTGLPVFAFSSLEALAASFVSYPFPVCSMIDAGRGEVYVQIFNVKNGGLGPVSRAGLGDPSLFLDIITEETLFVGSGAFLHRKLIEEKLLEKAVWPAFIKNDVDARNLAFLAADYDISRALSANKLLPLYLRKSDAELRLARLKA